MKTRKVHFTLGESAGQLIVSIAREHLIYSLNPDKALKAIKDSLVGCPTESFRYFDRKTDPYYQ